MNAETIMKKLRQSLDEKRYNHSLGVAKTAKEYARRLGEDCEKAYIAGLLHDCAKCMSKAETEEFCKKHSIKIDKETKDCPPVIHAPVGAAVAETEYGVCDSEILDAIRYHTVARANMTVLDKIIYLADMTEPNRDFCGAEELREEAEKDILNAYKAAIARSLLFNIKKEKVIHSNTLLAWNVLCKQGRKSE